MNPLENYGNDHSRQLAKLAQQADERAAKIESYFGFLPTAKATLGAAEKNFFADPTPENARRFTAALDEVRDSTAICDAITGSGGSGEARKRDLNTASVHTILAKGFAERISELGKLKPIALKAYGQRKGFLTEAGENVMSIEYDQQVCKYRDYISTITNHLAVATFGLRYTTASGAGFEIKTFDQLFGELVQPLPSAPTIPVGARA